VVSFYHFTVTVMVSRALGLRFGSVRIWVRFRFSDRVGIGFPDVEWNYMSGTRHVATVFFIPP